MVQGRPSMVQAVGAEFRATPSTRNRKLTDPPAGVGPVLALGSKVQVVPSCRDVAPTTSLTVSGDRGRVIATVQRSTGAGFGLATVTTTRYPTSVGSSIV